MVLTFEPKCRGPVVAQLRIVVVYPNEKVYRGHPDHDITLVGICIEPEFEEEREDDEDRNSISVIDDW